LSHTVLHQREAAFHDAWADSTAIGDILVRESFECPTALENQFILGEMGELRGKNLLDIGAGLGESSVYFALRGANVTTVDLSPRMVEMALNLGQKHGVKIRGIVSEGEDLRLQSGQYDLVYTANTIHHVQNRALLFEQMSRALKPGGKFFSCDPVAYNPVINVYRRMASSVRTADESPLTIADLKLAGKYFCHVQHREFWIAALALFVKYYALDHVHPNHDRYWKRILRETSEQLWWWKPLKSMDGLLTRIPLVRWLAWNMVMWGEKAHEK
jgi:2-polyprenyl-3-methyl-5-hydroxy-6-metoxy-1,4-benzoquinol methylase